MSRELVVAHYNENLDWLNFIKENFPDVKITVYTKGKTSWDGALKLENVGRESHTYLTHIIENYDNLSQFTTFIQGNPFEHCGIDHVINMLTVDPGGYVFPSSPIRPDGNEKFVEIESKYPVKDSNGNMGQWWFKIFGKPINSVFAVWNAQFTVRKELIKNRSLEFYKNALTTVDHDQTPEECHFFERAWGSFFKNF